MGRRALNRGRDGNEHPAKQLLCRASSGFAGGHPERWGCGWPGNAHCQPQSLWKSGATFKACLPLLAGLEGGRAFFNAVKEGDTVIFASDDEQDRILWVQAMYRATGQSHKPVPPTQVQKLNAKGGNVPQLDAPISQFCK